MGSYGGKAIGWAQLAGLLRHPVALDGLHDPGAPRCAHLVSTLSASNRRRRFLLCRTCTAVARLLRLARRRAASRSARRGDFYRAPRLKPFIGSMASYVIFLPIIFIVQVWENLVHVQPIGGVLHTNRLDVRFSLGKENQGWARGFFIAIVSDKFPRLPVTGEPSEQGVK